MVENLKNTYVFIVWSKVKWCRNRILEDLDKHFEILKIINVNWDRDLFEDNLLSFYGSKISNYHNKIKKIGDKEFTVIIIKDKNPTFEHKFVYDRNENVNINVYNKKKLYREWTGTNFRIHCSDNEAETMHDMCVLFGPSFIDLLNKEQKEINIKTNTYRFSNISNEIEFEKAITYFGNNIIVKNENKYFIFALNKINVVRFIKLNQIDKYKYEVSIGNENKTIYIFGEEEGDLPTGFTIKAKTNNDIIKDFISIKEEYLTYLKDRTNIKSVNGLLNKYDFDTNFSEKNSIRGEENYDVLSDLKKKIKYIIARMNNVVYSIKKK